MVNRLVDRLVSSPSSWLNPREISAAPEEGPLDILAGFLLWLEHPSIAKAKNVLVMNEVPDERNNSNFTFVKRKASGYVYLPNDVFEVISAYCVQERQKYSSEFLFLNLQGKTAAAPFSAGFSLCLQSWARKMLSTIQAARE